jgi:hypothetical protein
MGRITFKYSVGKKWLKDPISVEKSWAWCCTPVIPTMVCEDLNRRLWPRLAWANKQTNKMRPYPRITKAKGDGGMTQEVECLPSKSEAQISNLSTAKK